MKSYIDSLLELVYPEKNMCFICGRCGEDIGDTYVCSDCMNKIRKIEAPVSRKCGKHLASTSSDLCTDCRSHMNYFEISRSPFLYDGLIKDLIYGFKYYNKPYLYKFFGRALIDCLNKNDFGDIDFILSVPLHKSKMRSRGYNQSELTARYVSDKLGKVYADALIRTKKTPKQSGQTRDERRENLRGAFAVRKNKKTEGIISSSVLLIDDVYTTGSTVNECSKVLLEYGVNKVYVLTIAR
jgi:ComF family protein